MTDARAAMLASVAERQADMAVEPGMYLRGVAVVQVTAADAKSVAWRDAAAGAAWTLPRASFLSRRVQRLDAPPVPEGLRGVLPSMWALLADARISAAERLRLFRAAFAGAVGTLTAEEDALVAGWLTALRAGHEPEEAP